MKRQFLCDIQSLMSVGFLLYLFMNDFLPGRLMFAAVVIQWCFMIGVNVSCVYVAPQNIPSAIALTHGNNVVLHRIIMPEPLLNVAQLIVQFAHHFSSTALYKHTYSQRSSTKYEREALFGRSSVTTSPCYTSCCKDDVLADLPWKDERGPSSIRRTLEPFQRQHWGHFWETGRSAFGLFQAHI